MIHATTSPTRMQSEASPRRYIHIHVPDNRGYYVFEEYMYIECTCVIYREILAIDNRKNARQVISYSNLSITR